MRLENVPSRSPIRRFMARCASGDLLSSLAVGVGQRAAIAGSGTPPAPNDWFGPPFSPSLALGVALGDPEDEQALPLVSRADLRRLEQSSLNLETHAL